MLHQCMQRVPARGTAQEPVRPCAPFAEAHPGKPQLLFGLGLGPEQLQVDQACREQEARCQHHPRQLHCCAGLGGAS